MRERLYQESNYGEEEEMEKLSGITMFKVILEIFRVKFGDFVYKQSCLECRKESDNR